MKYSLTDVPTDLRQRLSAMVDRMETQERNSHRQRLSIAASLLILLAAGGSWLMINDTAPTQPTELTPQEAAKETQRALRIFTQAIERGQKGAQEAEKATQEATQKAFNTIKKYSK